MQQSLSKKGLRLKRVIRRDPINQRAVMDVAWSEIPVRATYKLKPGIRNEMYFTV